jgi:small subunit ribosomal protein S2
MFLAKHFVASAIHLGHKTNKWNPKTAPFLLAVRNDIHIIDIEQSILMVRRALNFLKKVCAKRGTLRASIPTWARSSSGLLSTGLPVTGNASPSTLGAGGAEHTAAGLLASKDGGLGLCSHLSSVGGALAFARPGRGAGPRHSGSDALAIPEVLFFPNVNDNAIHIREAVKLQIPVIGIIDSDTNPLGIQYPIPGNDDPIESILLYTSLILNAIADAKIEESLQFSLEGRSGIATSALPSAPARSI